MDCRIFILSAALWLAGPTQAGAACRGADLFPRLEAKAPAAYEAILSQGRAFPFGHGRLFRLTGGRSAPSYVFGTLHLADPRVTGFSPELRAILSGSRIVALETVEDGPRLREAMARDRAELKAALSARPDRRADRLLGGADFAALEKLFDERGLRKFEARKLKATVLALLLDLPPCAVRKKGAAPYADELIAILAREKKIPVTGLESMAEQLAILDGLSREAERDLLVAVLRQNAHAEDVVETTIARYEVGDLGVLLAWMRSDEAGAGMSLAQAPQAFLDRLITARNRRMRDRVLPLLAQGGAFIAVGAAHLPGDDGLLRLLQDEGYDVELVE